MMGSSSLLILHVYYFIYILILSLIHIYLINKAGGATNYAYLRGAKLTRVATAGEKKRMGDVIRLMSRQPVSYTHLRKKMMYIII